jgi:DNA-binding NarL/FixJ family response regulator
MIPWFTRFKAKPQHESLADHFLRTLKTRTACKRILLLEDDPTWRGLVRAFSEDYDVEFMEAPTSGMARYIMENQAKFDAVIIDIGVTNGDGITFYKWIKARYPKTRVVFLTGHSIDAVCEKINAVGSAPIYPKRVFTMPEFISDIFDMLGARHKPEPSA